MGLSGELGKRGGCVARGSPFTDDLGNFCVRGVFGPGPKRTRRAGGLRRNCRASHDRRLLPDTAIRAIRHRRRREQGSGCGDHNRLQGNRARGVAEHRQIPRAIYAQRRRARCRGQSLPARRLFPRLRRLAGLGHAARPRRLPERRPHQRSVRRHRELGFDSDRRRQNDGRHQQQPRLRPQRARRRDLDADEGRVHLAGNVDRCDGRLLWPRAGLAAMGQGGRSMVRLYRDRGRPRRRLSPVRVLGHPPALWRHRLQERRQRISHQRRRRR